MVLMTVALGKFYNWEVLVLHTSFSGLTFILGLSISDYLMSE